LRPRRVRAEPAIKSNEPMGSIVQKYSRTVIFGYSLF
jgi:hypothetical protein